MRTQVRRRRSPSLYALVVVVVATLVGVGLFVWGPVNPFLEVGNAPHDVNRSAGVANWASALFGYGGSFNSGQGVGSDGRAEETLSVANHSFAPVQLLSVRVVAAGGQGTSAPEVVHVRGVPATLTHGAEADVSVTVDVRRACAATHGDTVRYQILINARTSSGVIRTIGHNGNQDVTCSADALPAPGTGPSDPAQARAAIDRAFATAYDFAAPPDSRGSSVDDPAGLEPAVAAVVSGPYGGIATATKPKVIQVVFTAPSRATVLYDLTGVPGSMGTARIGQARLVDGTWKVTRATVCADLALAEVSCPKD